MQLKRRTGVVIYPFEGYPHRLDEGKRGNFLPLGLGEVVVIKGEVAPGWYYGHKRYAPHHSGLFPASYVAPQPKKEFPDFLEKLAEVCLEWGEIRKKLFVDVHLYQFEHIGRGIFELIEGRRSLLNQSLTQDQYRELARRLCSRIDWGNRKLGLDLIPWSFHLAQDEEEEATSLLPECSKDVGKLFLLHQRSMESANSRGSGTLSRPKLGKNKDMKMNDLYVSLRDFSYSFTDDCEVIFSLFEGKRFISETYTLYQQHAQVPQSNFHVGDDRPSIFEDVNVVNKRDLYLVVQIVRIGRMFYAENAAKKFSSTKQRKFRRPYACGVLSLNDVETLNEDELEFTVGCFEKPIKLYHSDEKDFFQIHELIVAQNQKNIVSKVFPVLNTFSVSIFWCAKQMFSKSTSNITPTKMFGINNLIAPPGAVRNDLYLTLNSAEILEKKQNKTGGAKNCNLEVEIQIVDHDDELLPIDRNIWKSIILHHVNTPKYNETVKFTIPIDIFPKAKLRCILRHCSAKDKTEKKMFGITWLSLMDPSGTTVRDGDHPLQVYKWTDEQSLPLQSSSLALSKDVVNLHTLMISTKFTQNIDLVNLLKWKQTPNLKPSLQNLIESKEATEEIVRKFLQDVLDALFTIFSDEIGNSTEYSGDVFTLLVNIFQQLQKPSYSEYKTVLDAYCTEHFAAALVYKGLLHSLKHYTLVLLNLKNKEDLSQLIQNCYSSLQFIFKFIVQSQSLYCNAQWNFNTEDSFRLEVKSLISSFRQVFTGNECSPVFVETQSILLQNFHYVYEELSKILPVTEVCQYVYEVFEGIPVKDKAALSPAKLQAIHKVVQSSLFSHSSCRTKLLPVFCKHIRHHLGNREELKLCTDVLQEILMFLHKNQHNKEQNTSLAIEVICTTTLENLVKTVLILERTTTIVGNLVTCLISLLELMNQEHFNILFDQITEKQHLRDLLKRVFILFRDLIKVDVFPEYWFYMKLLTNNIMLKSIQEFCKPLKDDFLKYFDMQLWLYYFDLAVTFISQPCLQIEDFRDWKKEWILEKYKDMRLAMCYQLLHLWSHLSDDEKRSFVPCLIGPFLEVTMIPQDELRLVTLQTLFYDMMQAEFKINGHIRETESELIDRLDLLINSTEGVHHGDEEYRIQFHDLHLKRLESESQKHPNASWQSVCSTSIQSLSNLQQLLLDYRDVAQEINESNRDQLMQCTVNLLNFYKREKRMEQYLRYIYKLHELHRISENYTEAGFTLLLHGHLLQWDHEKMLPEQYEPVDIYYPRQSAAERKELIYRRVLEYFDSGKVWEKGITLCKELADLYEKRYEYNKLSSILKTQATFYQNILTQLRPEPEYFRVYFIGRGFPTFVRNKEFIYRGQEYERLGAFMQRISQEWPNAELLQKNSAPDSSIRESGEQFLQICSVKPRPGPMGKNTLTPEGKIVPEKIRAFYTVNDVCSFQYDRRIEKGIEDDGTNEFKSMWIERTLLKTHIQFPSTLKWAEVMEKKSIELSPVEFACEKMEEANSQLGTLISQYSTGDEACKSNVNPLSMRLQGMLDAAVMGGIPKYTDAFFNEEFLKSEEYAGFAVKLVGVLQDQVKLLEDGLDIHGRLIPVGVQPLHKRLLDCHGQMKVSVADAETLVHNIVSSNGMVLLRSESRGNVVGVRESFRRMGSNGNHKSIINSPLPPVPKYCPNSNVKLRESHTPNSNRSSVSSGYGHVTRGTLRDNLLDDDDDYVYSQPIEANKGETPCASGSDQKPPIIPCRPKKTAPIDNGSPRNMAENQEYILMPPQRLREISGSSPTPPPPVVPPKPRNSFEPACSPPPPLLPRKPAAIVPPAGDANGEVPPPPIPPKPNMNETSTDTYMNKEDLLAEMNDTLNRNGQPKRPGSDHKEYFVPLVASKDTTATSD